MNTVLEQAAASRTNARVMPEPLPSSELPFTTPSGYMTGEEFVRNVIARITQFYKEHGLI